MNAQSTGGSRAARVTAILEATHELLREVGYAGLSIDAVAARAGASKATIYRRWPDKASLVSAVVTTRSQIDPKMPVDARDLRQDLRRLVASLAGTAERENLGVFVSLLAAAQQDAVIAHALRGTALQRRRQDCRDIIQRAIGRRELNDPALGSLLFDLVMGQILVRNLISDGRFSIGEQLDFVDKVLLPALTASDVPITDPPSVPPTPDAVPNLPEST